MTKHLIRPGTQVECAVRIDEGKQEIDLRNALVYDSLDNKIILSDTDPQLLRSYVGKRIAATYIDRSNKTRMGVSGKINKILKNYKLSSSQTVRAIILTRLSDLKKFNLRFAFRVSPPDDYNIKLSAHFNERVEISDISALGIRFRHKKIRNYKLDQKIRFHLKTKKKFFELYGRVVRIAPIRTIRLQDQELVAVRLQDLDKKLEDSLAITVRKIERHIAFNNMLGL